jgi:hypothetical protein
MTEPTPGGIDPDLAESHPDLAASMAAKAQEDARLTAELEAIADSTNSGSPNAPEAPPSVSSPDGVSPKTEHPAVSLPRDAEPVTSSDRPAPPPRLSAESSRPQEPKPDKTETKLAEADERLAWRIALERKDREVLNASEAEKPFLEAERAGMEAKMRELFPVSAEPTPSKEPTSKPEMTEEERAERIDRAKQRVEYTKSTLLDLVDANKYFDKSGEIQYDPDVIQTHINHWKAQEILASVDPDAKVSLSILQINMMRDQINDQRKAARKEGDEAKYEELSEDWRRLGKYKRLCENAREANPTTDEEIEELRKQHREPTDKEYPLDLVETKKPKEPVDTPPPPLPPGGGDPPIVDPPINPPEVPVDQEPILIVPEISEAQAAYDLSVKEWAAARIDSERLLAGKDEKERLAVAKEKLDRAFENYCAALSRKHVENFKEWDENINLSVDYVDQSKATQSKLEQQRALSPEDREDEFKDFSDEDFARNIQAQIDYQAKQAEYQRESSAKRDAELALFNQVKVEELMKVRARVDAEMLAQREAKHPKLAKINEWLKKHPKTRVAAGLALTAIGITGTVTGLAPLAVLGFGGRTALGAYGAYNASRGIGEMAGDSERFGVGKETKANISEELGAQEKQTNIRRWSKRAGAAAAAIVGAIGAYKLVNALDRPPTPVNDHRYGSINNGELNDRLANGDFISGPERTEAIARLKSVIGEDAFNRLGTQQREALLLLRNAQIDQAPEYFQHLAAGHFG